MLGLTRARTTGESVDPASRTPADKAELAKLVGASAQNISDMERGRRAIGKDMAQRLGAALNAPWKRFL